MSCMIFQFLRDQIFVGFMVHQVISSFVSVSGNLANAQDVATSGLGDDHCPTVTLAQREETPIKSISASSKSVF